jgi:pimeloyl-ACP methyl ester carboxylesterase
MNRRAALLSGVAASFAGSAGAAASALQTLMPKPKRAKVNGIELNYYEAGPRKGVPIVLCHGFPEIAFTWWRQIKAWSEAGFWVIAPDQRGYGLSSRPAAVTDYDIVHLTGDLVGLLDHLKVRKAIFCGHDWGGTVVWQMALRHPDRVAGVIGFGASFGPRAPSDPVANMRQTNGPDMYQVWFQTPGEADAFLGKDPERTLRLSMRKPEFGLKFRERGPSGSTFSLHDRFASNPGLPRDEDLVVSPAEMAVFVDSFRRTGFTGGINWYRNITRNWEISADLPRRIDGFPCLVLGAELDSIGAPPPDRFAAGQAALIADVETHLITGSGHWIPAEKPDETTRVVLDWLGRKFPH